MVSALTFVRDSIYIEGYLAGLTINNEACYISHKVL